MFLLFSFFSLTRWRVLTVHLDLLTKTLLAPVTITLKRSSSVASFFVRGWYLPTRRKKTNSTVLESVLKKATFLTTNTRINSLMTSSSPKIPTSHSTMRLHTRALNRLIKIGSRHTRISNIVVIGIMVVGWSSQNSYTVCVRTCTRLDSTHWSAILFCRAKCSCFIECFLLANWRLFCDLV